jgi:hypothetical protein
MVTAWRQMSALMLLAALGGCAVPSPPPGYEPMAPLRDLVGRPVDLAAGSYQVMSDAVPEGQFPCSVAVARLRHAGWTVPAATQPSEPNGFVLDPFAHKEGVCWAELFDNIASVSEVFPVDPPYLPSQPAEPAEVVQALGRVHAGLCVILSEGDVTVGESIGSEGDEPLGGDTALARQVVGAIYETRHESLLAIAKSELFAYTIGDEDGARRSVAEELASARFRELVHEAMCKLVASSRPGPVKQPSPWSSWPTGPGPMRWPGKR